MAELTCGDSSGIPHDRVRMKEYEDKMFYCPVCEECRTSRTDVPLRTCCSCGKEFPTWEQGDPYEIVHAFCPCLDKNLDRLNHGITDGLQYLRDIETYIPAAEKKRFWLEIYGEKGRDYFWVRLTGEKFSRTICTICKHVDSIWKTHAFDGDPFQVSDAKAQTVEVVIEAIAYRIQMAASWSLTARKYHYKDIYPGAIEFIDSLETGVYP